MRLLEMLMWTCCYMLKEQIHELEEQKIAAWRGESLVMSL